MHEFSHHPEERILLSSAASRRRWYIVIFFILPHLSGNKRFSFLPRQTSAPKKKIGVISGTRWSGWWARPRKCVWENILHTFWGGGRRMNIAWTIGKKNKIKRYKMNKCFAPAVFHLSCHLGSDYANLLPFCSRSFFFLLFLCRLFLCFFVIFFFFFMRKRFMFQRIWSLWSALVCHAQLTLLFCVRFLLLRALSNV